MGHALACPRLLQGQLTNWNISGPRGVELFNMPRDIGAAQRSRSSRVLVCGLLIASAACLTGGRCLGQIKEAPSFEVASVKVNKNPYLVQGSFGREPTPPPPPPLISTSPNSVIMTQINLQSCIMWAWDLGNYSVSAPAGTAYDIWAKASGPVPVSQLKLMLRKLLAERFHLKTHMEKRDVEFTVLLVAKGGPKLRQSSPGEEVERKFVDLPGGGRRIDYRNTPVSVLSDFMNSPPLGPAVDGTGLRGGYDFSFVRPLSHGTPEEWYFAWRDALEKQLGLTLGVKRGSLDVMVVDHADDVPTPN